MLFTELISCTILLGQVLWEVVTLRKSKRTCTPVSTCHIKSTWWHTVIITTFMFSLNIFFCFSRGLQSWLCHFQLCVQLHIGSSTNCWNEFTLILTMICTWLFPFYLCLFIKAWHFWLPLLRHMSHCWWAFKTLMYCTSVRTKPSTGHQPDAGVSLVNSQYCMCLSAADVELIP